MPREAPVMSATFPLRGVTTAPRFGLPPRPPGPSSLIDLMRTAARCCYPRTTRARQRAERGGRDHDAHEVFGGSHRTAREVEGPKRLLLRVLLLPLHRARPKPAAVVPLRSVKSITRAVFSGAELRAA